MRDERWFSGEEITTLVAGPLSYANDGGDDEDEEDEEEEKKKGDEDDEEEEEPLWTAPNDHRQVTVGRPNSLYQSAVCGDESRSSAGSMLAGGRNGSHSGSALRITSA